jgi:hypothetical protein
MDEGEQQTPDEPHLAGIFDLGDPIERAILNESEDGREVAARFVQVFGDFVRDDVRPVLRRVAAAGGEPQLLVNGLAELMRSIAESIEFPLDHPRAGSPNRS